MKFIEAGIGNTWTVRTEIEMENGSEYEVRGIHGPIHFHSAYIRLWIRKTVIILDSREGFKKVHKNHKDFKLLLGIVSKQ
ncbi:DUF3977 family protein [Mesobacillus sp. LC4]|uniref:DUF3977 family protein n=1 Tax=Mesobacillus selenatarsenatis TaxID=388741 RepID=A0A846TI25_9BACI|nr:MULTISPECIES: DUF3977 family protein [Mesobacillus]NKE06600.1 DUF3977 family protein [Mesobacillus selenatarsenatis]